MLKRIRFKNFRSLRDVEIDDLTPITVFIGANSSGKTNLVEGLYFLRQMFRDSYPRSFYPQVQREGIKTVGVGDAEPLHVEVSLQVPASTTPLSYALTIQSDQEKTQFEERLSDDGSMLFEATNGKAILSNGEALVSVTGLVLPYVAAYPQNFDPIIQQCSIFIAHRWQILAEIFMPVRSLSAKEEHDPYLMERDARNTVAMLDYLKDRHRYWYDELQKDLRWLLDHVDQVDVRKTYQDVQLVIQEKSLTDGEAPTISAGTLRQISMLTAYYALMETEHYKLPGLIVIEEPDTSVHPLLLGRFVDLLRSYTDRDEPRQFILTTHNPRLLDWFEPGEVRVVERDEQGYTSVRPVSKEVADIWLKEHTLGDAWLTRSLGGAPK